MRVGIIALGLDGVISAGPTLAQEAAGDPEAGRRVSGMGQTCQGLDGYAQIPIAPHIGGEPVAYLAEQLLAFRSGERENEMMSVVAKNLTDEQIEDVAAWYASHTATAVPPDSFDPVAAPMQCAGCHGEDGIALLEDVPHLAGENRVYTETQLKAFRNGQREHEIMSLIAMDLSEEELREVADWFSSIGVELSEP
jgi:cytochrome c553